jgi:hypothetical protein
MALVHPSSCECTKSELDLFEVPPTQTSVAYGYWEQKGLQPENCENRNDPDLVQALAKSM